MRITSLFLLLFLTISGFSQSYIAVAINCEPLDCGVEKFIVFGDSISHERDSVCISYAISEKTYLKIKKSTMEFHKDGEAIQVFDKYIFDPVSGNYVSYRNGLNANYDFKWDRL